MSVLHLCIDMQVGQSNIFTTADWATLKSRIYDLRNALDERNVPTVHVAYTQTAWQTYLGPHSTLKDHYAKHAMGFMWRHDMLDLDVKDDDLAALKTTISAWKISQLQEHLNAHAIKTVIISGLTEGSEDTPSPECCVRETAKDLKAAGYDVIIAAEATDAALPGFYEEIPQAQRLLKRQQDLGKYGVRVMPVADILETIETPVNRPVAQTCRLVPGT